MPEGVKLFISLSWQEVINIEPTSNINTFRVSIPILAIIECVKSAISNLCKIDIIFSWLFTCIMPQVLQELIDSPVGTSNEYLSISFFSVLSKVKRIILISAFNSCLLYLLFVNHNHFTLMNLTLFLSLRSLELHLIRLQGFS